MSLPWIHFIGSKGKGSTLHLLEKQALFHQVPVMVFQSPFILEEREMFRENGEIRSQKQWEDGLAEQEGSPFERAWQASEKWMQSTKKSLKLVECGWEAPWDATKSLPNEKWSVLTKIEEEHLDILGGSLDAVVQACLELATPCEKIFCDESQKELLQKSPIFETIQSSFIWTKSKENPLTAAMNMGLAQALWQALKQSWQDEALADWNLTGRFEKIHDYFYLDAAHTKASLAYTLLRYEKILQNFSQGRILFHFLGDKDPELYPMLQAFAKKHPSCELFWCPLNEARAGLQDPTSTAQNMSSFLHTQNETCLDLITGSFRLVALAKTELLSK